MVDSCSKLTLMDEALKCFLLECFIKRLCQFPLSINFKCNYSHPRQQGCPLPLGRAYLLCLSAGMALVPWLSLTRVSDSH